MKDERGSLYANPFLIWVDLAFIASEVFIASIQVIGYRMCHLTVGYPELTKRGSREFALMGKEKIEAVAESSQAMLTEFLRANQLGAKAVKQMMDGAMAMMSMTTSCTVRQFRDRQAKLARTVVRSTSTVSRLSASTGQVLKHGLKPIHVRVTSNAKRLKK